MSLSPAGADLLVSARILLFFTGTLLYGYLGRELLRRRSLTGNAFMSLTILCLAWWNLGCLLDEALALLYLSPGFFVAAALDLTRAGALVLAPIALAHAVLRLAVHTGDMGRWFPILLPAWATFSVVLVLLSREVSAGIPLTLIAGKFYWVFLLHTLLSLGAVAVMAFGALSRLPAEPWSRYLKGLLLALGILGLLSATGLVFHAERESSTTAFQVWFFTAAAAWHLPGLVFLWYVRRESLLRLSLTSRTLRDGSLLGLILLLLLASRFLVGSEGQQAWRAFTGAGVLVILTAALLLPATRLALRTLPPLKGLLQPVGPGEDLERLSRSFRDLSLDERGLMEGIRRDLTRLLGTDVEWIDPKVGRARILAAALDREPRGFDRVRAPDAVSLVALEQLRLSAVLPLRVEEKLERILALGLGSRGAGWEEGELASLRLVMRQLGLAVESRRRIQDLLETERRLSQAEKLGLLGMVSASLAHEIKNPLSSMKILSANLHEELARPPSDVEQIEEQRRDMEAILEQVRRLEEVTREILAFARPARGDRTDLQALVRSALYILGPHARRRGIELDGEEVEAVGDVPGGAGHWQTIAFNLLHNAVEHAPSAGTVRVSLGRDGSGILLETWNALEDEGPEDLDRLFQPFESEGGTGLGLSLARRRVEELGGSLTAEKREGGLGFLARIPGCAEPAAHEHDSQPHLK